MGKSLKPNPVPEQNLTHFNHNLILKATAFNLTGNKKQPTKNPNTQTTPPQKRKYPSHQD